MPTPVQPVAALGELNSTADAKNVNALTELRSFYAAATKERHLVFYCGGRVNSGAAATTYALANRHRADNAVLVNASVPYSLLFGGIYLDPSDWGLAGTKSLIMQASVWTPSSYTGTTNATFGFNATTGFTYGGSGTSTLITGVGASLGSIAFGLITASSNITNTANLTVPSSPGFYTATLVTTATTTANIQFEVQIYGWDD